MVDRRMHAHAVNLQPMGGRVAWRQRAGSCFACFLFFTREEAAEISTRPPPSISAHPSTLPSRRMAIEHGRNSNHHSFHVTLQRADAHLSFFVVRLRPSGTASLSDGFPLTLS